MLFGVSAKRILAKLRQDVPLAFLLVPFVAGQCAGFVVDSMSSGGSAGLSVFLLGFYLLLRALRAAAIWRALICILLAGAASAATGQYFRSGSLESAVKGVHLYGDIVGELRYPQPGEVRFDLRVAQLPDLPGGLSVPAIFRCKAIHLPWRNSARLKAGDHVAVHGDLYTLSARREEWSYAGMLRRRGISAGCRVHALSVIRSAAVSPLRWVKARFESAVRRVLGEGEVAGLLLSISLGVRDTLTRRTEAAFKAAGLMHTLVVSGYHIGVVYLLLVFCLRCIRQLILLVYPAQFAMRSINLIPPLAAVGYATLCDLRMPAVRAALAILLAALGMKFKRRTDIISCALLALLTLTAIWPGIYLEPGVQLTFLALVAIGAGSYLSADPVPPLQQGGGERRRWRLDGVVRRVIRAVKTVAVISVFMTAGSLLIFGEGTLLMFPGNLILAPLIVMVGCQLGIVAMVLSALNIPTGDLLLRISGVLLEALRAVVLWLGEFTVFTVKLKDSSGQIVLAVALCGVGCVLALSLKRYLLLNGVVSFQSGRSEECAHHRCGSATRYTALVFPSGHQRLSLLLLRRN